MDKLEALTQKSEVMKNKATEIIYNAFKNKVIATTKDNDYTFEDGDIQGSCYLCNRETTKGFKKKDMIKPTFVDQEISKNRNSDVICECCAFALSFTSLRNYAIYASENSAEHPNLQSCKEIILDKEKETPFVLCIPTSGQKWLSIKAKVNLNNENIIVRFENDDVFVNVDLFKTLIDDIELLLKLDFTKTEILSLNLNSSKVMKSNKIHEILKTVSRLELYKNKKIYKLAVHLAQKGED